MKHKDARRLLDEYHQQEEMLKAQEPIFDQLVKQTIMRAFDQLATNAGSRSSCEDDPKGCTILDVDVDAEIIVHTTAYKGPPKHRKQCSGDSYCSCSHSIPRAIIAYLKRMRTNKHRGRTVLITKNEFWPCTECEKITADSEIIDMIVCDKTPHLKEGYLTTSYRPEYIPHFAKHEIEADLNNTYIKSWLAGFDV